MAATYHLTIVTPKGLVFDEAVESLSAAGEMGRFGVLANHATMLASLAPGFMKINTPEEKYFAVGSGILEVSPGGAVNVLADSVEVADSKADAVERSKTLTA